MRERAKLATDLKRLLCRPLTRAVGINVQIPRAHARGYILLPVSRAEEQGLFRNAL